MKKLRFIGIAAVIVLSMVSCREQVQFPDEPVITFKEFVQSTDENGMKVGSLMLHFTDGDGNLGLEQSDTTGVFCIDECFYYYNLFCNYYEKENGEWIHFSYEDGDILVPFYYRVPKVTPGGQNPALEGDIEIDMPTYFLPSFNDTCRFEVFLVDRALNHSNIIVTRDIIKP